MTTMRRSRAALTSAILALGLLTTGCGGSDDKGSSADPCTTLGDATAALSKAKQSFDDAPSIDLTLETKSQPKSGNAILGANGTLTHQPAFKGSATIFLFGGGKEIDVTAVDGKVIASLLGEIDPAEFGAPNPADFADPKSGISGLLLKITGISGCEAKFAGKEKVAEYTGTLAGDLVAPIIPSASKSGAYRTTVGLRADGSMATLQVSGAFFDADGDVTYDLTFTQGESVTISAP